MLVRGSNYVRMDMGKLLSNKNHHRYRSLCIISKNVLLASVLYALQSKDQNNETNTHTNVHIQYP